MVTAAGAEVVTGVEAEVEVGVEEGVGNKEVSCTVESPVAICDFTRIPMLNVENAC